MKLGINDECFNEIILHSRCKYYFSSAMLIFVDYLNIICAVFFAEHSRNFFMQAFYEIYPPLILERIYIYGVVPCIFIFFLAYTGLYTKRIPFWQCVGKTFNVCLYVNILVILFTYFLGAAENISRLFLGLLWFYSFCYLCFFRYLSKKLLLACGLWQIPILIIGAGKTAELLAVKFEQEPGIGYKIIGLVEDNADERFLATKYPVLGSFVDIEKILKGSGIQDVLLATPGADRETLIKLIYQIQPHVRNLTIVPDLFGIPMSNISVDSFYNEKTVVIHIQNNLARMHNRILKRTFDLVSSILGIIIISPILLIIALLIYKSSPGPVVFSHMRIGANGKKFPCYKFRSMVNNAQELLEDYLNKNPKAREEWENDFKLKNDPRITSIGSFLRRTSLDELPQLFNVIKGEMSLVGPRPIIDKEIEKYGDYIHDYYIVSPGMTGYWQVSGRSDVDYQERVQMDSWYVRNWSLWQDIILLFKTVGVVSGKKGAY